MRYTANVIVPNSSDRVVAVLERLGYQAEAVGGSGVIVQGTSPSLEKFISDLEQRIPPRAVIDDFGVAG